MLCRNDLDVLVSLTGRITIYLLIELLLPGICQFNGYRVFYNVYNSGIAVLTTGSFLKGILDIAELTHHTLSYSPLPVVVL